MSIKRKESPIIIPFNPLDKRNLGESVADALMQQPVVNLPPDSFFGAGIYAIYYTGDFPLYSAVSKRNISNKYEWPIYVGKAVPEGSRKGGYGLGDNPNKALYQRLKQHSSSISQVENLNLNHFFCRFLVVDDIWIPLAESLLIEMLSPLWNKCIDGFGIHTPGKGRVNQQKSEWDTIHPGRHFANKLPNNKIERDQLVKKIKDFLSETPSD